MKTSIPMAIAMLCIAITPCLLHAQQEEQQVLRDTEGRALLGEGDHSHATLVPQPEGTALINSPRSLSLEQNAVNKPSEFEALPVVDDAGNTVGEVDRIARRASDNVLHAVVRTEDGPLIAAELDDLNVAAFMFWSPDGMLQRDAYEPADYQAVDEHQVGHSAYGSLSDPAAQTQRYPAYSRTTVQADQQVAADAALQQNTTEAAVPANQTAQSSIVQMALTQAERMRGISLIDASGEELGVIAQIVRRTSDDMFYALVNTPQSETPAVVELSQLKVGRLALDTDVNSLQELTFDEIDFRTLPQR